MKKILYSLLLLAFFNTQIIAQVRQPGIPFTLNDAYSSIFSSETYIPQTEYSAPDLNKLMKEDLSRVHGPLDNKRIGAAIPVDFSFPSAGSFTTLNDGRQVWRARINVNGALALGLYYDKFNLPDGVKYYLSNANGKQLLGAYTSASNPDDGLWANEKVQGGQINLEMDIEAGVDISQISMHINNVASFYASISYLQTYAPDSVSTIYWDYGLSSPCEINAICPIGAAYPDQRHASVHIEYYKTGYIYAGSGTMMNNVRQDGIPYLLTASHVEATSSTSNTTFSTWVFYFNYETPTCQYTGGRPDSTQTVSGATFKARSYYDSSSLQIVGDFLLLQLRTQVPVSYGAYLSGWDISTTAPTGTSIGFHHPSGDVKKVSTTTSVNATGNFNGGQANSHWEVVPFQNGGFEEGSSGSGLFNPSGRLIGDLTGGNSQNEACTTVNSSGVVMNNHGEYSKLTLNWLYAYQTPSSAATRLQDWLDPDLTGTSQLDAIPTTGSNTAVSQLNTANNTVAVFPSPSTGMVYVNGNFSNANTAKIEVFNIIGNKVLEVQTSSLLNNYQLNLTSEAPGVYLVRISAGASMITKKVLIAK